VRGFLIEGLFYLMKSNKWAKKKHERFGPGGRDGPDGQSTKSTKSICLKIVANAASIAVKA